VTTKPSPRTLSREELTSGTPQMRCQMTRRALVEQLGEPHYLEEPGLAHGKYDLWACEFPCGLQVIITLLPSHTDCGARSPEDLPSEVWLRSSDGDPGHLRCHLSLTEVEGWLGGERLGMPTWAVWRQDDNGIKAQVSIVTSRCEAERLRDELESRGHKQLYWIEQVYA
jgi:hypothetical protein